MVVPNVSGTACAKCDHFACICEVLKTHLRGYLYRLAVCGIAIECEHGYDVCPKCDPCSCESVKAALGDKATT